MFMRSVSSVASAGFDMKYWDVSACGVHKCNLPKYWPVSPNKAREHVHRLAASPDAGKF